MHLLITGALDASTPEAGWIINDYEDNLYLSNQYGYTLTGPVWIPKVFNGRNRLFFMSNYEGYRSRKTTTPLATVLTNPMRMRRPRICPSWSSAFITVPDTA